MTVTDEDKAAVRAVSDALATLNTEIEKCGRLGIDLSFIKVTEVGCRNEKWVLGEAVRTTEERIR